MVCELSKWGYYGREIGDEPAAAVVHKTEKILNVFCRETLQSCQDPEKHLGWLVIFT